MKHEISTWAWVLALTALFAAQAGYFAGAYYGPSYFEARKIEVHLRHVFCEQAIRNNLLKTCEVER